MASRINLGIDSKLTSFFYQVAFYGLGLNNAVILNAIGYSGGSNVYEIVSHWICPVFAHLRMLI